MICFTKAVQAVAADTWGKWFSLVGDHLKARAASLAKAKVQANRRGRRSPRSQLTRYETFYRT